MNEIHLFTSANGVKGKCDVCGKTYNAKAHKQARLAALAAEAEANAVAEAREDMLPEASATTDDSEIADALAALEAEAEELVAEDTRTNEQVEADAAQAEHDAVDADNAAEAEAQAEQAKPAKKAAPAKKAQADGPVTASLWVGWRITNAAVLRESTPAEKSLAAKLKAAKPTGDLDRTVRLTVEELAALDVVAERFQKEGTTGPEIYSGRALRGRIAAAVAKIEAATKENSK